MNHIRSITNKRVCKCIYGGCVHLLHIAHHRDNTSFRNIRERLDDLIVHIDALQKDILVDEFIVIMQEHRCVWHWREPKRRDAHTTQKAAEYIIMNDREEMNVRCGEWVSG